MAITGEIGQGSDWLASCKNVVDKKLPASDPDYEIDDADVTLDCYNESVSPETHIVNALPCTNDVGENDYYGTVSKTITAAQALGDIIRCVYTINAGVDRYHIRVGWARVVLPTNNLSE